MAHCLLLNQQPAIELRGDQEMNLSKNRKGTVVVTFLNIGLVLAFAISQNAYAGRKVAIIVNGGDLSGSLTDNINNLAKATAEKYQKKESGYEVIEIDAQKGMSAADFTKTLSGLTDVDQVSITFLSHGSVRNQSDSFVEKQAFTEAQLKRFPKSYLRPDELATQVTGAEEINGPVHFGFAMQRVHPTPVPHTDFNEDFIGLGDLHDALSHLKKANTNAKITITSLACFGSNATRSLQDIPDVQVFAGSSASQTADVTASAQAMKNQMKTVVNGSARNFDECTDLGCQALKDQNEFAKYFILNSGGSYLDAFSDARRQYLSKKLDSINVMGPGFEDEKSTHAYLVRPLSSLELLFQDQCLGPPPRTETQPYCKSESEWEKLQNFQVAAIQPEIVNTLNKTIEEDNHYIETLRTAFGCDPAQSSNENSLFQNALLKARAELEKRAQQLQQSDVDKNIADLKTLRARIQGAKSIDELLKVVPDRAEFSMPLHALKLERKSGEIAEDAIMNTSKEDFLAILDTALEDLEDPEFLKQFKDGYNLSSSNAQLQKCQSSLKECNFAVLLPGRRLHDNALYNLIDSYPGPDAVGGQALQLIMEKCPSSALFKSQVGHTSDTRRKQIECVLNETKSDPILRAFALRSLQIPLSDKEKTATCNTFDNERKKNKQLNECVALRSNRMSDDNFWKTMASLYVLGTSQTRP
jgi:hypothetical protein